MNLAFCLFKYKPLGGLEMDFMRILRACVRRGHTVTVFTMSWSGPVADDFQVKVLPVLGFTNHGRAAAFARKLRSILARQHYDIVVGFNRMPGLDVYYAADVCYKWRVKQQYGWWYRLSRRYRIYAAFEKAVFAVTAKTKILYLADMVKNQYMECYGTPAARFQQLGPGLAPEWRPTLAIKANREAARLKYKIAAEQQLLLFIGSNFHLKGLDRVLRAVAALPQEPRNKIELWIVGAGDIAKYSALAQRLGVASQVQFLGGRDDVMSLLLATDLLMHPARREAAGLVLLEAITVGVPVLTTASCGYASYVQEAQAGTVLPLPFKQQNLDESLLAALSAVQLQQWQTQALQYAADAEIYGREDAVIALERFYQS